MENTYTAAKRGVQVVRMTIGGVEQGMIIGSAHERKPVILHLHGGPGMPDYALFRKHGVNLDSDYNVCWWEQRGAGISNNKGLPATSLTLEQLMADALEVTDYLRKRFHKERIVLMGHSWGSFLALNLAFRHPELYEAYIGIGQIVNQLESEKRSFKFIADYARASGNAEMLAKTERFASMRPEEMSVDIEYLLFRTEALNNLGAGFCHGTELVGDARDPLEICPEYGPDDIAANRAGLVPSVSRLWPSLIGVDLSERIPELQIPVYLIHGVYDKQVYYDLTKDYFGVLKAPFKQFFTFGNSAHYPHLEEKEKFLNLISDLV
jgi:pimeloyl-ACP methyl ester carboxylesterase